MAKKMKQKQKQKQKQMQVVNVTVNATEKKPARRRAPQAPRAKKAVAGDSVMLHRGDLPDYPLPKPYPGYAPIGEPLRLAGPGQNYANLPRPLQSASYASSPSVMNPQASASFVASPDVLYHRNRNKNDDVRQIVNPSDITPMPQPSVRINPSQAPPGAGYMPSAPPRDEERSVKPPAFQGEVPRLNIPDESPSMRAVPSAPSSAAILQSNMSYPGFPFDEEQEEMVSEEEDAASAPAEAVASSFEPADRRTIKRPKKVGGEASGLNRDIVDEDGRPIFIRKADLTEAQLMTPVTKIVGDSATRENMLYRMLTAFGVTDARKDPRFRSTPGSKKGDRIKFIEQFITDEQQARIARGKRSAMRRGGSVF